MSRVSPRRAPPQAHTIDVLPERLAPARIMLADSPRLDGARCIGRPQLFDQHRHNDPNRDRDQATALRTCASCPALTACRAWLDSLPAWQKPPGVIAGQVVAAATP